jgi:hypothetical protein
MEPQEYRVSSIFIVPLIVFFVGVLLFIALLHGQRDLIVFAILILGVVTGTRLWSRYGLSGIRCYSAVDRDKMFPDERLSLTVTAENAKFLPIWLQMTVPVASPLHPGSEEAAFTEESGLLWYQKARFDWDLIAQRRGVHRVGPPHIKAADIFGFFPRQREEHESLHVIVYPRLVPCQCVICLAFPGPKALCKIPCIYSEPGITNSGGQPDTFIGRRVHATTGFRKRSSSPRSKRRSYWPWKSATFQSITQNRALNKPSRW